MRMAPRTLEVVPVGTLPVEDKNQKVLDYVHGRLCDRTSQGQCILHIGPGGEIRKVEWRSTERAEDIVE
jgi:hypothetical protein